MAFLEVNYYSRVLGMNRVMNVLLPEESDHNPNWTNDSLKDLPVLYLLHGMSGNHFDWQRKSDIERLLRQTKLAVIMPATDLAWYTNTDYGMNYFDAISQELPRKVASLFPQISTKRKKHFVAGMSMGGYGAFKLAFSSSYFSYAASLSGTLISSLNYPGFLDMEKQAYWKGIFGDLDKFSGSKNDIFELAKRQSNTGIELPKLYAWVGQQDFLYGANEKAIPRLRKMGYDVSYETNPGDHEWYYWSKYIENILQWLPINYQAEKRLS
ncbi:acetylesterase [Oenococcus oeni]|uniref:Acetylesterase n=1 Tax=Oenococcus oeni TaxID=1247 RepID=A0A483BAC0_OENOE|nr:alpha/beta hydrolase family protein [Oenococcus oeni]KGI00260.1 acetyl esterase [Oenococcus oeni IOEB_C52]MDV7687311.1 esterase family protein [Oenococcus oeni]OIK57241.1 acetylesterase [Oenococcus oeni]OIM21520.1 acetylesterase [Oenococcus oeni]OIM25529.1 acetylesterase [Oenococcus oeni]